MTQKGLRRRRSMGLGIQTSYVIVLSSFGLILKVLKKKKTIQELTRARVCLKADCATLRPARAQPCRYGRFSA
uniref:Uncharacterized protein n=1 Tax=Anguilla anguilla TaxID=7936 RepID=A0A0E9S8U0_ANGAN